MTSIPGPDWAGYAANQPKCECAECNDPLFDPWCSPKPGNPATYGLKDSGKRQEFESGMVRDVTEGKTDYTLVLDGPMFERWAAHMTKGAQKYEARNWMKAEGEAELTRFRESALRHLLQWMRGDTDEDHAAAVFFNINGAAYVLDRMSSEERMIAEDDARFLQEWKRVDL